MVPRNIPFAERIQLMQTLLSMVDYGWRKWQQIGDQFLLKTQHSHQFIPENCISLACDVVNYNYKFCMVCGYFLLLLMVMSIFLH